MLMWAEYTEYESNQQTLQGGTEKKGPTNLATLFSMEPKDQREAMAADNSESPEDCSVEPTAKEARIDDESIHADSGLHDLSSFEVGRVLSCDSRSKSIVVQGRFTGREGSALIILQKKAFDESNLRKLCNVSTSLKKEFQNDIYGNYDCFPEISLNALKATVIHPATEKHIRKFESVPLHIIEETPELYRKVTLPHISKEQFNFQWIYNILERKSEVERIVVEDPDPVNGFVIVPDLKWDGNDKKSLYLIALARPVGIKSLRDLDATHLPLLRNIFTKGTETIEKRYGLPSSQLRVFLHYQPTFYHLHVHFTYLQFDAPGIYTERAHLLTSVINNIELMPDYYQRVVLPFTLKETDTLFSLFSEEGAVKKIHGNDSQ